MRDLLTKNHLTIKKIFNLFLKSVIISIKRKKTKMEKVNYYTIQYRPYKDWGIWTVERIMTESQLQEFIKEKPEIIKITKHRKLPKEYKQEN